MTSRQTYLSNGLLYTVSPDARLRPGFIAQSIVSAQLVDEHTGQAPQVEVVAATSFSKLTPKSTVDGIAGLTGVPVRALQGLQGAPYDVPFTVRAQRYVPFAQTVHFIPQPMFPDVFSPWDFGVVRLHREPVILRGRVARQTAGGTIPVAGATVSISNYWLEIPLPAAATPPTPPNLLSLKPAVFLDRSTATAQMRRRDFTATADVSELIGDAPAGSLTLRLSNRVGLAPGEIVRIDSADPDKTEYLVVQSVSGSSSPDQPADVTMRYPGRVDHRPGASIEHVQAAPAGPNNALISDAVPGDTVLLTGGLTGIAGASTIEIDDGVVAPEYHTIAEFSVITDADGFYRLPALNRVGQLELNVNDGVNPAVERVVVPNYELVQNTVDIALN